MTPLPQGTLPLATTPAFTPRTAPPPRDAGAWTQALARATAGAAASAAAGAPAQASEPCGLGDAAPQAPFAARSFADAAPAARPHTGRVAAPVAVAVAVGGQPPAATLAFAHAAGDHAAGADATPVFATAWIPVNATSEPPPARAGDAAPGPQRPRAPAQDATGPRVHVEVHDDGLAVWLGLDAGPQAALARAAGVLEALRRQESSLPRLASLVCNGIPIHARPHPSKETP